MPAAAFAEIALAAGSEALGLPVHAVAVNRLEVEQMLPLDGQTRLTTQLIRSADDEHSRRDPFPLSRRQLVLGMRSHESTSAQRDVGRADRPGPPKPELSCHPPISTPRCDAPVHIMARRSPR